MSSKMIPEGLLENDPPCGRFHHFLGCFHLNKLLLLNSCFIIAPVHFRINSSNKKTPVQRYSTVWEFLVMQEVPEIPGPHSPEASR